VRQNADGAVFEGLIDLYKIIGSCRDIRAPSLDWSLTREMLFPDDNVDDETDESSDGDEYSGEEEEGQVLPGAVWPQDEGETSQQPRKKKLHLRRMIKRCQQPRRQE